MPIPVSCPNCGFHSDVPDDFRGKHLRCRTCKSEFKVPLAESSQLQRQQDHKSEEGRDRRRTTGAYRGIDLRERAERYPNEPVPEMENRSRSHSDRDDYPGIGRIVYPDQPRPFLTGHWVILGGAALAVVSLYMPWIYNGERCFDGWFGRYIWYFLAGFVYPAVAAIIRNVNPPAAAISAGAAATGAVYYVFNTINGIIQHANRVLEYKFYADAAEKVQFINYTKSGTREGLWVFVVAAIAVIVGAMLCKQHSTMLANAMRRSKKGPGAAVRPDRSSAPKPRSVPHRRSS